MKRIINTLLLIAVLVSVSSCQQDIPVTPQGNEEAEVLLHLRTSEGFRSTRALSYGEENKILTIDVLVFSGNTLVDIRQGRDVSSTTVGATPPFSGSGLFSVLLPASASATDKYTLVILANAGTLPTLSGTYTNVIAALWHSIPGKMYQTAKEMAMWGEIEDLVVSEDTPDQTVALTRAVARIDIGLGTATQNAGTDRTSFSWDGIGTDDKPIPFVINSVYVMRANNRYALIPAVGNRGTTPGTPPVFLATAPTIPAGTTAFAATPTPADLFRFAATDGYSSRAIYVPEANILQPTTAAEYVSGVTDPKSFDANHKNRMAIVVGGYYGAGNTTNETFYRIDFNPGGNLVNVLRNHLYRFDIASVGAPGLSTPEEAYSSFAVNMKVNIEDWDITDTGEIFIVGPYRVTLQNSHNENRDDRTAILWREIGSTDKIIFRTSNNIVNSDFVLEEGNGWKLPDPNNKMVIENDRFRVEIKTDINGVRFFEFTAITSFSSTATDNPSYLNVKVKDRIEFEITMLQRDSSPYDWTGGGDTETELGEG